MIVSGTGGNSALQGVDAFPAPRGRCRQWLAGLIGHRPFGTAPAGKIADFMSFAQNPLGGVAVTKSLATTRGFAAREIELQIACRCSKRSGFARLWVVPRRQAGIADTLSSAVDAPPGRGHVSRQRLLHAGRKEMP